MRSNLLTRIVSVLVMMTPVMGMASVEDDPTSLSYISYLERYATVFPAGGEETLEAVINMPLMAGDRLDTARETRMETILADGTIMWMDEYTTVSLDSVALSRDTNGDRTVLFIADGAMMLEIPPTVQQQHRTRVDGASETVYLQGPGVFRVEVLRSGGLWVEVWEGLAEAVTPAGGVVLRTSSATEIGGGRIASVDSQLTDRDDFARWVQSRRGIGAGPSGEYVDARYAREASQLDAYGTWIYLDSAGTWAWQPTVGVDWRPYTAGRWYWTSVGWSWLAYEPWGWLPYHHGSWWNSPAHGWVWCWGRTWSPAWVHWSYGGGYVGWCAVGWYSSWWWGHGWGWGGYYPGHGGGYYPPHGGGSSGPRRSDVVPGSGGGSGGHVRTARPVGASDLVLDMEGRARRTSMDSRAWSIVSERDFTSPRVGRIVVAGGDPLRTSPDRNGMAVISSKPLITASPRQVSPASELARVFEGRERMNTTDLTRVVARADSLNKDEALASVKPRTAAAMTTQRSTARVTYPVDSRVAAGAVTPASRSEQLSYGASDGAASRGSSGRGASSNIFRSTLNPAGTRFETGANRGLSGGSSGSSPSTRSAPSTRSPSTSSGRSLAPGSARVPVDTSSRTPVGRSTTGTTPQSSGSSQRSPVGQVGTVPSTRSPIVLPRTGSTTGSSSSRTPVVPRTSSGSRSAPSPRASAPSRLTPSTSRPVTRSYGTKSSGSSSRPSSSSSSAPRVSSPSRSSSSAGSSRSSSPSRSSGSSSGSSSSSRSSGSKRR